jgi:uncharacterized protein GlcG (DUF336 family)
MVRNSAALKMGILCCFAVTVSTIFYYWNFHFFHREFGVDPQNFRGLCKGLFLAAAARRSTRAYMEVSQPGGPAYGIQASNQGRFIVIPGGLPIFLDQQIVGGVGCSSGHCDQDETVALAGIDALLKSLKT